MYEHVDRSMILGQKEIHIISHPRGKIYYCVGLFVNDQDVAMQFLEAWLAPYKTFVIVVGKMPMLTLFILMAKV
jgi:hypothetical protein